MAAVTPLPRRFRSLGVARPGVRAFLAELDGVRLAGCRRASRPRQIQLEIDAARESLAATLDQLTYRTSPTRLKAKGRDAVQRFLQTPAGMATVGAVGLLITCAVVQKIRHRND